MGRDTEEFNTINQQALTDISRMLPQQQNIHPAQVPMEHSRTHTRTTSWASANLKGMKRYRMWPQWNQTRGQQQ